MKTPKKPVKVQPLWLSLGRLWLVALVLFVGAALAAWALMDTTSYSLTQTHLTRDVLLSQDGITTFTSAAKPAFDLEARWAVIGLMVLSGVFALLHLTKFRPAYDQAVAKNRVWPWRWVELGVTSAIMIELVAAMAGYTDLAALKLMAGAMVVTTGLGWVAERQNAKKARRPDWSAFGLSLVVGSLPWLAIGAAKTSTILFGEIRSPWYAYTACVVALVGFGLLAANQFMQHRRKGAWASYEAVERNYLVISVVTKLAFAAALIIGLQK